MASKQKQEKEAASVCVCGRQPCVVKMRSKYMLSCPSPINCPMRSSWASNEQEAIKSWNTEIQTARQNRKA